MSMLLTCPAAERTYEGFAALAIGSVDKAEEHFQAVLDMQGELECLRLHDVIEAHNGMGAVSLAHRDLMDAKRWYHEARYLLDDMYGGEWPKKLDWRVAKDQPAIRNLMGHGHVHYASGELEKAKGCYEILVAADKRDGLGAKKYLTAIMIGQKFEEV